jgi:hypothetical protein
MRNVVFVTAILSIAIIGIVRSFSSELDNPLEMIVKLGLPKLEGQSPACR